MIYLFLNRVFRAIKIDIELFEEVEKDKKATFQAGIVVVMSSLEAGVGSLHLGAYIWIFITPMFIYLNYRNFCIRSISKYCLLVLIIIFLPPLVAFAYYFCFVLFSFLFN